MGKLVAAINMTLDGFCDHIYGKADDELHEHYNQLLRNAGGLLYGRITYQLMEAYWPMVVKEPTGIGPIDEFAQLIDQIPKKVYSRTLREVNWKNTELKKEFLADEVITLREQNNKDILIGSRSLIQASLNLQVLEELQLCIHPVLATKGLPLFNGIFNMQELELLNTKALGSGALVIYYRPVY